VDERVSPPVLDAAFLSGDKLTMPRSPHYFKLCKISAVALIKMVALLTASLFGGRVRANRMVMLGFHSGHTRTLRRAVGDYGAYAGEGRRAYPRGHGFVRASRPGHRDARQCGERGKRVHGPVHSRVGESTPPPLTLCAQR